MGANAPTLQTSVLYRGMGIDRWRVAQCGGTVQETSIHINLIFAGMDTQKKG